MFEDGTCPTVFTAVVTGASGGSPGLGGRAVTKQGPQSIESVREGGNWSLTPTQPHSFLSEILLHFAPA